MHWQHTEMHWDRRSKMEDTNLGFQHQQYQTGQNQINMPGINQPTSRYSMCESMLRYKTYFYPTMLTMNINKQTFCKVD